MLLGLLSLDFKTTDLLIVLRDEKNVALENILTLLLSAAKKGDVLEKLLEFILCALDNGVEVVKLLKKTTAKKS